MYSKAYRWVAEMEEIAEFVGDDAAAKKLFEANAQLYQRIAKDFDGAQEEVGALAEFVKPRH
jgi:putative dehydrogenase